MKKSLYFLALSALIFSACNTLEIDKNSTSAVKIGKVSVASTSTKAGNDEVNTVYSSDEITIEEVSTPLASSAGTKATEKGKDNLSQFNILGYYDASIHSTVAGRDAILNFMPNGIALKDLDTGWSLSNAGKWAHDTKHHFWAYSGGYEEGSAVEGFAVEDDITSASFTYSTDGSEDLLVAYTSQKWDGPDTHSDACGDNDEIKELKFHHALAELAFDYTQVNYTVSGETVNTRGSIVGVSLPNVIIKGDCSMVKLADDDDAKLELEWDPSDNTDIIKIASSGEDDDDRFAFVIPQKYSTNHFTVSIRDNDRNNMIKDKIIIADINTDWYFGLSYTYKLRGSFAFPPLNDPLYTDLTFNVEGKGYLEKMATDIQSNLVDQLTLSWTGKPNTSGNGTGFYLFFSTSPVGSEYNKDYLPTEDNKMVCFVYDAFANHKQGAVKKPAGYDYESDGSIEFTVNLPTLEYLNTLPNYNGTLYLYAAYNGGAASDKVNLTLDNFKCHYSHYRSEN